MGKRIANDTWPDEGNVGTRRLKTLFARVYTMRTDCLVALSDNDETLPAPTRIKDFTRIIDLKYFPGASLPRGPLVCCQSASARSEMRGRPATDRK